MTEPIDIRIGRTDAGFLLMRILGRKYPESMDYWSANWLLIHAQIYVGAFTGDIVKYKR